MQNSQKDFYKKLLGRIGEGKAVKFLRKKGYAILEKNYRTQSGEIDIVALDKGVYVFVEVKTRTDDSFGAPSEAVDYFKRQKLIRLAQEFFALDRKYKQYEFQDYRFDVVEILGKNINHIENAFAE